VNIGSRESGKLKKLHVSTSIWLTERGGVGGTGGMAAGGEGWRESIETVAL
jgi:hypothetical protein